MLSRARVSESRATDERGDPELVGYLLGKGDADVLFSVGLEMCLGGVAPQIAYYGDRLPLTSFCPSEVRSLGLADHANAFYRLPC